jgi:glycyl-tRNA synthetase
MAEQTGSVMDRIVALCKRRGFIFQSSEIYGGINGFWDYGPLGVELKRNVMEAWWDTMVYHPPLGPDGQEFDMVGLETSIIMHPQVWKCSGHYDLFSDLMVDCRNCKARFRADKVAFLTLMPAGSIANRAAVQGGRATPDVRGEPAKRITIAMELDLGGVALPAEQAVCAYARVNNIGPLKHFRIGEEGTFAAECLYLAGHDSRKEAHKEVFDATVEPDFECLFEFLLRSSRTSGKRPCPVCHHPDSLTEPREFNLMLETYPGAVKDEANRAFLRPETAQGMFVNFKNVVDTSRVKVPFGMAQMGKSFRNEITPRNFIFRSREFEQMEMEFFCHPSESAKWYEFWRDQRMKWYTDLGLKSSKLRLREHDKDELSHYSCGTSDIEYAFPFLAEGDFGELEGIAHRGDFDLRSHMEGKLVAQDGQLVVEKGPDGKPKYKGSGKDLTYYDDERRERFVPHVIEPAAGATRSALAFICEAYTVDETRPSNELMKFHPKLAPIKAGIFPLVNKDGMPEIAEPIYRAIRKRWPAQYDAKAAIGKRYARMDEAGTPYCFTIDGQTKEDGTVTVRDRDTGHQERIDKSRVVEYLAERLG